MKMKAFTKLPKEQQEEMMEFLEAYNERFESSYSIQHFVSALRKGRGRLVRMWKNRNQEK